MLMVESLDQAANLSRISRPQQPVRVIAVTGGKGGVGKTTVPSIWASAWQVRARM